MAATDFNPLLSAVRQGETADTNALLNALQTIRDNTGDETGVDFTALGSAEIIENRALLTILAAMCARINFLENKVG